MGQGQRDWTPLHAAVHRVLRFRTLLSSGQSVLVAVSGGQDSLCLIKLLLDLQPKWFWSLGVVHCDHGWRPDSSANAAHVNQLAKGWEIPFYLKTADQLLPREAAAREWRYAAFLEVAREMGYSVVVTGHTASDRAETLLYNLVRGSGTDGLQALTWQRPLGPGVQVVRPLLEVTRQETAEFCQNYRLPVWEDSTNLDVQYVRNRLRQLVFPHLRQLNPQVEQALAQTAEVLQAEVEYLETLAEQIRREASHPSQSALNRSLLQNHSLAIQRRVVRQFLKQELATHPTFNHIEKFVALMAAPNHSQTDPFPGGKIAQVEEDWITLQGPPF
ncbi:MAG: tRNA lysidine(34) synthetase TilS [Leptolyngbyaceae cyanobacterium bins.59]|nr:tRNA lysidine(34) synthetase TilS [Leptolyngbyaceae cyanobacterium bins.59]